MTNSVNSGNPEAQQKKVFFPNLDGIRFFCFLSVFLFHTGVLSYGSLGVNFFFVLSGYLITYLLIQEKKYFGRIHIVKFWIRRILRIWPLYFLCVILGFFIMPFIITVAGGTPINETASLFSYLTFTSNFDYIKSGPPQNTVLLVLWSIAVEEQFYLVWPLLLAIIPVKRYPLMFLAIILVSILFRWYYDLDAYRNIHTMSCVGDMAVGAMGAYLSDLQKWKDKFRSFPKLLILALYIVTCALYLFKDEILGTDNVMKIFERTIYAILFLFIILEQNYAEQSYFKASTAKAISMLGIISYGLYCYHQLTTTMVGTLYLRLHIDNQNLLFHAIYVIASLLLTIIVAKISYAVIESPLLRLKFRYSYVVKGTKSGN